MTADRSLRAFASRVPAGALCNTDRRVAMRTYSRWYWFKWRIAGRYFPIPETITSEWYRQECPPSDRFMRPSLTPRERLNWAVSKWLRESRKWCPSS